MEPSSRSSPCAGCQFLRRKCERGCIFAPYFPPGSTEKFIAVHRAFGASNVTKILSSLPEERRHDAVISLCSEAEIHLRNPVKSCLGYIKYIEQYIQNLSNQIAVVQSEICRVVGFPAVDFLQNFSSPQSAMSENTVYLPQIQMLGRRLESLQVDGPGTLLPPAPQQTNYSAPHNHFLHHHLRQ